MPSCVGFEKILFSAITENSYSIMIGDLINDAKTTVENSHEWTALRQTVVIPTVADQSTYAITGAYQDAILKEVMNDTSNWYLNGKNQTLFQQSKLSWNCTKIITGLFHMERNRRDRSITS